MSGKSETADVIALWEALRDKIDARISDKTSDCIRAQRATVVTAPDSSTGKIVVQIPFDKAVLSLPYSSAVASVTAGTQVWVICPHGDGTDWSNGVVVNNGKWTL